MNNSENTSTNSSGLKRKLNDASSSPNKSRKVCQSFYVKLAAESPIRIEESSDELYDSANERETDFAQDTEDCSSSYSDSESISSQGSHVIEAYGQRMTVIEYEVASDSQTSDCFLFSESSSGTEGTMEAMIYGAMKRAVDVDSSTSKEFPILADSTDDSVDCSDREFTPADYWKCVRCKNSQNNPMYRYCEKCYRLRKSLFPPRPKSKKKKRNPSSTKLLTVVSSKRFSISDYSSSDDEITRPNPTSKVPAPTTQLSSMPSSTSIRYSTNVTIVKKQNSKPASSPSHNINHTNPITSNKNLKRKREETVEAQIIPEKMSKILKEIDSGHGSSCSSQEQTPHSDSQETLGSDGEKHTEHEDLLSPALSQHSIGSADTEPIHSGDELDWQSDSDDGYGRDEEDAEDTTRKTEEKPEIQTIRDNRVTATDSGLSQTSEVGLCAICRIEEKNAAFVHRRFVHFAACYRCAVKSWSENKNCPICFGKVSNVVKVFIQ